MMSEPDTSRRERVKGAYTLVEATGVVLGRQIGYVQDDEQVLVPFTGCNAVFVVSGDRARDTVVALEETGLDGTRISFLRLDTASLSADEDATPPSQVVSASSESRSERSVVKGAILGGIGGAVVIGLIVAALTTASAGLWAALGGLALGGALGGLWAGFNRMGASDAFERSLHVDPEGYASIAIHMDDEDGMNRVSNVLKSHQVWLFGRDGAVLRRP